MLECCWKVEEQLRKEQEKLQGSLEKQERPVEHLGPIGLVRAP